MTNILENKYLREFRAVLLIVYTLSAFSSVAYAQIIKRADYFISIPEGSNVKAGDKEIDLEHFMEINFPDDNSLNIGVVDDKEILAKVYKTNVSEVAKFIKQETEENSDLFKAVGGTGVKLTGKYNGMKVIAHVGYFKGEKKGFFFSTTYLQKEEASALKYLLKAIATFRETP